MMRKKNNKKPLYRAVFYGGDGWTRTSDPLRVKQVLSQLSYASR